MRREYPEAPIIGVGAVVIDGGKVLLVRRGQEPLKGEWSLPGGALELGETLQQGVVREVLEETGLTVVPGGIVEVLDRITQDDLRGGFATTMCWSTFYATWPAARCAAAAMRKRRAGWSERNCRNRVYRLAPVTVQVIEKAFRLSLGAIDPMIRKMKHEC